MAKSTSQIVVGGTGTVYVAPVATVAPVDIATAWGASWVDLGYTTEDGVSFSDGKTMESLPVWQMFYAARHIITGRESSLSFTLRQWSKDTVKLAFGGGTITTTAGPPAHYLYEPPAPGTVDERALGVEWIDGSVTHRLIVPRGIVTENVESNITKADASDLPITFSVMGSDGVQPWYFRSNSAAYA